MWWNGAQCRRNSFASAPYCVEMSVSSVLFKTELPIINYPAAIEEFKGETRLCSQGEFGF